MNRRGRQIKCYVACTPLFGVHIEGAILVMADIEKVNSMVSVQEIEERQRQAQRAWEESQRQNLALDTGGAT